MAAPTTTILALPAASKRALNALSMGLYIIPTGAGKNKAFRIPAGPIFDSTPRPFTELPRLMLAWREATEDCEFFRVRKPLGWAHRLPRVVQWFFH